MKTYNLPVGKNDPVFNILKINGKYSIKIRFKPSFKCFKNEKINFIPAFLKLETSLFQNMFILFYHILYL